MSSFITLKNDSVQFQNVIGSFPSRDNAHALSLKDIYEDEKDLLENAAQYIQSDVPANIEELIEFYNEAPQSDEPLKNNRLNPGQIIHQIQHPLHIAARDGDIDAIKKLLEDGFDINDKDNRNILAIHVAALFGQTEAVSTLISFGADVNTKGYESNTALHFALLKQHYDVANTLITDGGANSSISNYDGKTPITIIFDDLAEHLFSGIDKPESMNEIKQIMALLEKMQESSAEAFLYSEVSEFNNELYVTPYPASAILKVYASMTSSVKLATELYELALKIAPHDSSDIFINAKDMMHRFPTGEIYKINIGQDKKIWFISEGHLGIFTTALAVESLNQFRESFSLDTPSLKSEVFSALGSIYQSAVNFSNYAGLEQTAEAALQMYDQGQTVLLTSGWDGHFVDVILSKPHGLYIVANSGDRYHGEAPDYNGDPAGIIFYQMHEPDRIDAQFMYNILNNTDKMVFEYENAYEYGIFEKIDEIVRDTQEFGNCGWESHRDAIEGILYIELLNQDIESDSAKQLAHDYYEEWDTFHGSYVIDHYMENNPGLPLKAMLDIFTQLHQKEHFTANDHHHAQKIADAFVSAYYIEDFKTWLVDKDNGLAEKLLRNIMQEQHGIDIDGLIAYMDVPDEPAIHLDIQFENLSLVAIDPIIPTIHQEQLI